MKRLWTVVLLVGLGLLPAGAQETWDRHFTWSTRLAERMTAPEALSPWAGVDGEIERLVVRGELPLEAYLFRPIDRGELAAWLCESGGRRSEDAARLGESATRLTPQSQRSPSRTRLEDLLRWETDRWLASSSPPHPSTTHRVGRPGVLIQHQEENRVGRPGVLIRHQDEDRVLLIGPYLRVRPVLRDGKEWEWTDSTRIGVRGVFYPSSSVVISVGLFVAEVNEGRSFADPLVAGTDLILHEQEVTLSARLGGLRLRLGRDRHRWGPGISGTLLLSDASEPFNFAEYQLRLGPHLRFLALTGCTSLHQERYLSAHRLTWSPDPDFSISFSEGARYQANGPHLLYLAGFVPYTLVERLDLQDNLSDPTRDQQRNNVLWSLDLAWRPRTGWLCYAEILADDIATESSAMPTRGGYQVGMTLAQRWRDWDWTLGVEYTRVSNFTYSVYYQDLCACDWEQQGLPVGYALGPDVASVLARCVLDPVTAWGAGAWLSCVGKGEGRIGQPWKPASTGCCPSDPDCGEAGAWTLSGTAAWTLGTGLELHWRPAALLQAGVWFEAVRVEHAEHAPERSADWDSRLGLSFSLGMH